MMNSDVVATIREGLELLRYHAGYHDWIGDDCMQFVPDVAKRATIDTALHALDEAAGWELLEGLTYHMGRQSYMLDGKPIDINLLQDKKFRLFRKRQPAREGVT